MIKWLPTPSAMNFLAGILAGAERREFRGLHQRRALRQARLPLWLTLISLLGALALLRPALS